MVAQSSVKTTYVVSDGSDDESRSFTVKWDKSSDDVTKTHTLNRDTDGCTPPTTEPPTTTTTAPPEPPKTPKPPVPAKPVPVTPSFTG